MRLRAKLFETALNVRPHVQITGAADTMNGKERSRRRNGQLENLFTFLMLLILVSFALILVYFIPAIPVGSTDIQPFTTSSFIDSMQLNGAAISKVGPLNISLFSVPGTVYTLEGEQIILFQYDSLSNAARDAALISGNGSIINGKEYAWQATPHFYLSGQLMVLYLGSTERSLALLSYVVGQPFTGAPVSFVSACSLSDPCPAKNDTCVAFLGDTLCLDKDPCTLCGSDHSCKKIGSFPVQVICSSK